PKIPLNLTLLKGCAIVGVFWGEFTRREPQRFAEGMQRLAGGYAEGKLKPHVSETFPLERAADALRLIAERKVTGKVVLVTQPTVNQDQAGGNTKPARTAKTDSALRALRPKTPPRRKRQK